MPIPMEISSLMATKAGFGSGVRTEAAQSPPNSFKFTKTMEEAAANADVKSSEPGKKSCAANMGKQAAPITKKKPDKEKVKVPDTDEALAVAAMENGKQVVVILEGDEESATTPDICVDNAMSAVLDAIVSHTDTDAEMLNPEAVEFEKPTDTGTLEETANTAATETMANTAETGSGTATQAVTREEDIGNVGVKEASVQDAASVAGFSDGAEGEVTARRPFAGESERHGNAANNPNLSEKGDLSPLENENDEIPIRGHKDKTSFSLAASVKNAARAMPGSAFSASAPLVEGLKPEQFKANQQMKIIARDPPVSQDDLISEMVSRIETIKTENQSIMSIQLKPEFLGKVALEIATDAAGLRIKINAADGGVRAMIDGQINTLIESLENKGIEVAKVEVNYTGFDNGAFKEERREGQAQPDGSRRTRLEAYSNDTAVYYSTLPLDTLDYYIDAGLSSVEYQA
ncbi:MAG: flagellar hook-length control protein FliK [Oscillospiraceae bacterium]|nr:flagellar hook-length control protein FliK [Oscillospiraceae bacterium]